MGRHPIVKWAQRPDTLYITIDLPDAQDVKLKLGPEGKFLFSATTGKEKTPYEVDLDLYDKIDVNESKASIGLRNICYLVKKAESKWWSRLIKQEGKTPVFLKVDWDKWVDEDEESDAQGPGNDMDFGDLDFSKLSMGGGGDALDDVTLKMKMLKHHLPLQNLIPSFLQVWRMKQNLQSDEKAFNWCGVCLDAQPV
ncbi:hypothetical protein ACLB2K_011477 [Fragaria x ananassa]